MGSDFINVIMFNKLIVNVLQYMPQRFVWIFSKRYIAGEDLADAISATKKLNKQGIKTTIDLLGEFQSNSGKIDFYKKEYLKLIDECIHQDLDNSFSVKPTMFGLMLDQDQCYENIREVVARAAAHQRMIRIDMEDSQCTSMEIELYKRLLDEFPENVGLVLQAYLRRTLDDLKDLAIFDRGRQRINIRICKGIYNEPAELAYKDKDEINKNYITDLEFMIRNKMFVAIATHDRYLISEAYRLIGQYGVTKDQLEFQMLYGVTPELRKSIVEKGYKMRVYVPYGRDWLKYSIRRLKENPKMMSHMIKALFVRGL